MSNFGFFDLRLVAPYELAYQDARSAVNASEVLQKSRVFETLPQAIEDATLVIGTASLGHRDLQLPLERLEAGVQRIRQLQGQRVALLFGSEKFGLSNDDLAYCDSLIAIPTRAEHESMNLGQAVAICLYELIRDGSQVPYSRALHDPANAGDLDRLEAGLLEALQMSGYVKPRIAVSTQHKLRRLLRRLQLNHRDSVVWAGMLRQVLWKLRSPDKE